MRVAETKYWSLCQRQTAWNACDWLDRKSQPDALIGPSDLSAICLNVFIVFSVCVLLLLLSLVTFVEHRFRVCRTCWVDYLAFTEAGCLEVFPENIQTIIYSNRCYVVCANSSPFLLLIKLLARVKWMLQKLAQLCKNLQRLRKNATQQYVNAKTIW